MTSERTEQHHPRRWAILALTSVGAFMAPLDGSIVAMALPKMGPLPQLSRASAFQATMRVVGRSLSVAILGGIAASHLGSSGWRQLLHSASLQAAEAIPSRYAHGRRLGSAGSLGFHDAGNQSFRAFLVICNKTT